MKLNKIISYFKKNYYITISLIVFLALGVSFIGYCLISEDTTILPSIVTSKVFKVRFEFEDGTLYKEVEVKKNETTKEVSDPVKEGYKFEGWYYQEKKFDFNTKITENIYLIAKFTEITIDNNEKNKINENNKDGTKDEASTNNNSNDTNDTNNSSTNNSSNSNNNSNSNNSSNSTTKNEVTITNNSSTDCLKANNVCDISEIVKGISVTIKLNGKEYKTHVISDTDQTLNLLMDDNLTSSIQWVSSTDWFNTQEHNNYSCTYSACNYLGAITANNYLISQSSSWGVPTRLVTKNEVSNICVNGTCPCWVYNNLNGNKNKCPDNTINSIFKGYWMSDIIGSFAPDQAAIMSSQGYIDYTNISTSGLYGIRPVISMKK